MVADDRPRLSFRPSLPHARTELVAVTRSSSNDQIESLIHAPPHDVHGVLGVLDP